MKTSLSESVINLLEVSKRDYIDQLVKPIEGCIMYISSITDVAEEIRYDSQKSDIAEIKDNYAKGLSSFNKVVDRLKKWKTDPKYKTFFY